MNGGRASGRVPTSLLVGPSRVLRPGDAAGVYAHPRSEFARLERSGVLHRVAAGYYAVVPDHLVGRHWLPELEAVALGVAVSGVGVDGAALMGLSAARVHGALPRAVAVAVVAVARHRRPNLALVDRDAEVLFVRRNVGRLDVQRQRTELAEGWVTTVEQTVLDLAARPGLGGAPEEAGAAARALLARADLGLLEDLAREQRRGAALRGVLAREG